MELLINDLYSVLFVPRFRYPDGLSRMRARVTLSIALLTVLISLLGLVILAASPARTPLIDNILAVTLIGLLVQIVVVGLVHAGQLRAAMSLFFTFLLAFSSALVVVFGLGTGPLLLLTVPLLYVGLIASGRVVVILLVFLVGLVIATGDLQARGWLAPLGPGGPAPEQAMSQALLSSVLLAFAGVVISMFSYEIQRLARYAGRIVTQLRATAEIAQIVAAAMGAEDLLQRIVNYIRDRFGFYHVQVFLIDAERRYANLAASTGEAGEILLQRGYRLALTSQSAIGHAIRMAEPTLAATYDPETEATAAHRYNELLRDTRSQLVVPLIVGDQVIGALDVQSARPNAFDQEIADNLSVLAAQVSVGVYNNQQLEEYKLALNDTRRQFLEAEVNLREAQRLNQRLTGQAWETYLQSRRSQIIGYTLQDNRLQRDSSWTAPLKQAAGSRRPIITPQEDRRQVFAVPIELRGRAIGAIEVEMDGVVRQAETLEVLQSVAQRLALGIDNARLFEQAQELAQRELEVNTISANLQGINDLDELARATIQELSRALGAAQASIRLGTSAPQYPEIQARDAG